MRVACTAGWVFAGMMLAVSGVHAQDVINPDIGAVKSESAKPAEGDTLLRQADALIAGGKPAEAYALLEPLEFERAGDVHFDYLIGIAALDSGKPDKATLAFERVLAVDPNFAGARLDMARAYYQLGDLPRARVEFEAVLTLNPPKAARATIQNYLEMITAQSEFKQTRMTAYLEGVMGYDNNVNAATAQSQISISNILFTLSPSNVKTADSYLGIAAGAEVNHSISPVLSVYAGVDLRDRSNLSRTAFSSISMDGHAGVALGRDADVFRIGVQGGQYTLASVRNRDTTGLSAEWRHSFSQSNQLTVFAQNSRYRFVDTAMKVNDFDQIVAGAGWLHALDVKSALFGSLYYGTENDVAATGRIDGGKRFSGFRIGGQSPLNENADLFASMGAQFGGYTKTNVIFLRQRVDRQYDFTLGANWHWDKLWTVRPQLSYSRNDSNIVIYGYNRADVSLTLRRDFQ